MFPRPPRLPAQGACGSEHARCRASSTATCWRCRRAARRSNGQIVVARLGDEVTVKRFRRTRTTIELLPENPDFQPIVVPFGDVDFELEGIAVGLLRNNMMS